MVLYAFFHISMNGVSFAMRITDYIDEAVYIGSLDTIEENYGSLHPRLVFIAASIVLTLVHNRFFSNHNHHEMLKNDIAEYYGIILTH